jgi:hypothetical protein
MKNLTTKEFANECVKHMITFKMGVRALGWKIKDEESLSNYIDMLDLINGVDCDSEYYNECVRRFSTKSMVNGKFTEHESLEDYNEFREAFLECAKNSINALKK